MTDMLLPVSNSTDQLCIVEQYHVVCCTNSNHKEASSNYMTAVSVDSQYDVGNTNIGALVKEAQ